LRNPTASTRRRKLGIGVRGPVRPSTAFRGPESPPAPWQTLRRPSVAAAWVSAGHGYAGLRPTPQPWRSRDQASGGVPDPHPPTPRVRLIPRTAARVGTAISHKSHPRIRISEIHEDALTIQRTAMQGHRHVHAHTFASRPNGPDASADLAAAKPPDTAHPHPHTPRPHGPPTHPMAVDDGRPMEGPQSRRPMEGGAGRWMVMEGSIWRGGHGGVLVPPTGGGWWWGGRLSSRFRWCVRGVRRCGLVSCGGWPTLKLVLDNLRYPI
jgi:hypothetical protein